MKHRFAEYKTKRIWPIYEQESISYAKWNIISAYKESPDRCDVFDANDCGVAGQDNYSGLNQLRFYSRVPKEIKNNSSDWETDINWFICSV